MDDIKVHRRLRPYYDPDTFNIGYSSIFKPDQGVVDIHGFNIASKLNIVAQSNSNKLDNWSSFNVADHISKGLKSRTISELDNTNTKSLNDLEWFDLANLKVWKTLLSQLVNQFFKRYFQHLIQQPCEVAKLLLQVGDFDEVYADSNCLIHENKENSRYNTSDSDEVDYFPILDKDTIPIVSSTTESTLINHIKPQSLSTINVLNSIIDLEGIKGIWKANNTTFIYNFLSVTLDAWFTGLLSSLLQIPDPYFIDIIHSPDLNKSIWLTLSASILTGIILLPIDLIKTRLIITSVTCKSRSLRALAKQWPWRKSTTYIPGDMLLLNVFNSLANSMNSKLTGVLLYYQFNIDKYSHTFVYNTIELAFKVLGLFIKLPLEQLLRRRQVAFLLDKTNNPLLINEEDLIVTPYSESLYQFSRRGRKLSELWRGWRLSFMSVVCGYGLKIMNNQIEHSEEEKF